MEAVASCVLSVCLWGTVSANERPNFVFILTDDQSYGMMGCDGNEQTRTPNIDQLARDGVFFDRAYITSAICTPSRISILLSQFERKHCVNFNSGTSVSPEAWAMSYPVVMRDNGYYTGYVGKNHSPIGDGGYESGLMDRSFDYFYAGHGHIRFYPKELHEIFHAAKSDTQVEIVQEGVDDFLSNEHRLEGAIRFLDSRPEDKPFCLSVCFNLPHDAGAGTMQSRESDDDIYKSLYRNIEIPLPEHYVAKADITEPKLPPHVLRASERQTGYDYSDNPYTARQRIIRRMQAMTGIDRMVGKVREKLHENGLDKNTIIIFTSDHGLFTGEQGLGGKALCYEQTTHVPFIVCNPMASESERGRRCDEFVQSIDIAPMMLDYAGIDAPKAFQGKSIRSLVEGSSEPIHDVIFTENLWATHFGNPRIEAVQDKEWKYIRYYANDSFPSSAKIDTAKQLGIPVGKMLYAVADESIAVYRHYVESPLKGEEPIFEELYHIGEDPQELRNVIDQPQFQDQLERLRAVWKERLAYARGTDPPKVMRYTETSELERKLKECLSR
ncbi:MAG: sulfatase-like hydrolase/transferase [Rhodopirellula sp. JB053]